MINGGNGLTSWFECLVKNKLTMFGAHCPFIPLDQLAESKVYETLYILVHSTHMKPPDVLQTISPPGGYY